MATIFKYLNGNVDSRCVTEGEEVLFAKQLIMCGLTNVEREEHNIIALCLQTSALTAPPHEIKGGFLISASDIRIKNFTCSCKAGLSGTCKHVSACLFYCARNDIQKLEILSTTDVQCYWTKSKSITEEDYKATPIHEYSCLDKNRRSLTIEQQQDCLQKLRDRRPLSALYKHCSKTCGGSSGNNDGPSTSKINPCTNNVLTEALKCIIQHAEGSVFMKSLGIDISSMNLKSCCKKVLGIIETYDQQQAVTIKQGSDEWKALRRLRITGSTCYEMYTYAKSDWEKKSRKIFFPKPFTSVYTAHGLKYEKEALSEYKKFCNNNVVELGFMVCNLYPWLGYSPDGVVVEDGHPVKLLEIKCPYSGITEVASTFINSCKYLECDGENVTLKKRHTYYGQIQLGLAVLNLDACDLVLYSAKSKTFVTVTVKFDVMFATDLIKKISNNYFSKMLHFSCKK